MKLTRRLKLAAVAASACALALTWCWGVVSAAGEFDLPTGYELPFGANPFAPSNAKTATGRLIAQGDFIPASRCATCHEATHVEWSESAHRNSFREPFYQANVEHLIRDRDITVTRHCESCHNPAALFSGSLTKGANFERPFDEEGVSCSICHSIQSVTTEGIGSYTIAPPALLEFADGRRVRDASDKEVLNNLEAHSRAVMRPLLKGAEFCATCHKSAILPELNGRKWFRTFSVYDEWQQSAFAGETVQPLGAKPYQSCQSCHMPRQGQPVGYASHRWAAANTAIASHYGWTNQLKAVSDFLKAGVVTVDVFALRSQPVGALAPAPLVTDAGATVARGRKLSVDVVVANKGVGHAFPAELRDMFEAWVEFEATDASGRVLAHSGAVRADGTLEWDAHAYRAVPIDSRGEPVTRHDIWNTRVGGIDRFIPAGRADLARFSFDVPADAAAPLKLTAKLNYRRFNSRFVEWVSKSHPVAPTPVVEMSAASADVRLADERAGDDNAPAATGRAQAGAQRAELRKRWRSYGVALFDQQQYEAAAQAFEQARTLAEPNSADEGASCVDLALTYMRMERAGSSQAALTKADECVTRALEIAPADGRARFYRALLSVKQFRYTQAQADLETLARERPRDRQVWMQLASLYLLQRRDAEARAAYEHVLTIDPDDTEANFKLAGLYWRFGDISLARVQQDKYQARHNDTVGETLRRDFLRRRPDLYVTWPWREFGDNPIGSTP
jgi:tetratricopeptide (TPR) repeat protein